MRIWTSSVERIMLNNKIIIITAADAWQRKLRL